MESIVNAALVGSARAPLQKALPTATSEGQLVSSLTDVALEERLLLAAGVRAISRLAGYTPGHLAAVLEPAPDEIETVCGENVANLMHQLFTENRDDLRREAISRMAAARLILPPAMLPLVLGNATVAQRPLVAQVAGERGAWLGGFNTDWAWVRDLRVHHRDGLPPDADTIWQEGAPADRLQILARWRASDPTKAREEITAIWRQEKADFRVEMIGTLATNLSAEDEPFLESALDDRSTNVRVVAQRLLGGISGSAYQTRAASRADALLSLSKKKLNVTLPEAHEKTWERDGVIAKPRQGMGERSWWLMQIVAITPPAHWVERFGMPPADLIAATDEHASELLEGWARATVLYHTANWVQPLLDAWRKRIGKKSSTGLGPYEMCELLLPELPPSALEAMALKILREGESKGELDWDTVVAAIPVPWSTELARAWLAGLRVFASEHLSTLKNNAPDWLQCTAIYTSRLPPECLDEALAPWDIPENKNATKNATWQAINWRDEHEHFLRAIRLRQRIRDEIVR